MFVRGMSNVLAPQPDRRERPERPSSGDLGLDPAAELDVRPTAVLDVDQPRVPALAGEEQHRHADPLVVLEHVSEVGDVLEVEVPLTLEGHDVSDLAGVTRRRRDERQRPAS